MEGLPQGTDTERRSPKDQIQAPEAQKRISQPQTQYAVVVEFCDYPQLHIPNTNNTLEEVFTDIKTKLRVHAGITKDRRSKFIQEYMAKHY